MRLQARGKLHLVNHKPEDLYLQDFLYEEELEPFLDSSDVVPITDEQMEEAMSYAVNEYREQMLSRRDKVIERLLPWIDKIMLKFLP